MISTAVAFAPAPRGLHKQLSRVGAPVPVATARVQPTLAVSKLPGAEFNGCVAVQGSWLAVYYGYAFTSVLLHAIDATFVIDSVDIRTDVALREPAVGRLG